MVRWSNSTQVFDRIQTTFRCLSYAARMAKEIALTTDELAALRAVDGSRTQPPIPAEIETRLAELRLVERRQWPNGPLWRTTAGNRLGRSRLVGSGMRAK
jgi:hypothetical protein